MAYGDLKDALIHAVIDGKIYTDGSNLNVSHNPGTADVQKALVFCIFLVRKFKINAVGKLIVIDPRRPQHILFFLSGHILHCGYITCNGTCGMHGVPPVTDGRIEQYPNTGQQYDD